MQIPTNVIRTANSRLSSWPSEPRPLNRDLFRKAMRKISKSQTTQFAKFHAYLRLYRRWSATPRQQATLIACEHMATLPRQVAVREAIEEHAASVQSDMDFLAEEINNCLIAILHKWQTDPRAQECLLFTLHERNKIGYNTYRTSRDGHTIVEWAMDPVRVRVIVVNANGVPDTVYEYDYSEQVII